MPVANVNKVLRRKEEMGHASVIDDCNNSYVFDYHEDRRARAEDDMEQGYGKATPKRKKKRGARIKKREIEELYGSSEPNIKNAYYPRPSRNTNTHSMPNIGSDNSSINDVGKRKIQMRDTDRLLRGRGTNLGRQDSGRPGMTRQDSGRPGMPRQDSGRPGFQRGRSLLLTRQSSHRSKSSDPSSRFSSNRPPQTVQPVMKRSRSQSLDRSSLIRSASRSRSQSKNPTGVTKMEEMQTPPRTLLLIWIIVAAELGFDLATTVIAFIALLGDNACCEQTIELGPIPLTITFPFFMLVVAELSFLFRAMMLTLWPSIMTGQDDNAEDGEQERPSCFKRFMCCCLRWNAKAILRILNFFVLLNPFFGCVIAWMLLYQSDKTEAFVVLGLEGGSIILHFMSIYLEGSVKTMGGFLFHCIPLIPFVVSVALILVYLKQGGVCYLVERGLFQFSGCETCPETGYPPVENTCQFANGTNYTMENNGIFSINDVSDLTTLTARTYDQASYCAYDHPDGPQDVNFCFFEY